MDKLKELTFLRGYLMYLRVEDPYFKEASRKFNLLDNLIKEERREKARRINNNFMRY